MTQISYVHGLGPIPQNEWADRGREVQGSNYLPYNSLTVGEAFLALQRDRLKMLSRYYPESKQLKQGVAMLDNALNAGISRGVSFIGAIPNELQDLARIIDQASRYTQPAVRGGIMGRSSIYNGIGEVVDLGNSSQRFLACLIKKGANPNAVKPSIPIGDKQRAWVKLKEAEAACRLRLNFEDLLNNGVTGMGHHMLYKSIDRDFQPISGSRVDTKRLLQVIGVESCAKLAEFSDATIMYEWLENGILAKNMEVGAGPVNSVKSSFILSPEPEALWAQYLAENPARAKWEKMNPGISGIGILPAVAIAIVGAITAAIALASDFLAAAREKNSLALSNAQGFGSIALKSEQSDWALPPSQTGGGINQNTLLLGGAAVAAYFLLGNGE